MNIRLAEEKDIDSVIKLLTQVLNIHAKIRPDIFIGGTTKYTKEELMEMMLTDLCMWQWMRMTALWAMLFA